MRRRVGTLIENEVALLHAALELRNRGTDRFHGYLIARWIQEASGAQELLAHGTLYKTMARLEEAGFLESEWEVPKPAIRESRPRRRLYTVTPAGERALMSSPLIARRITSPTLLSGPASA